MKTNFFKLILRCVMKIFNINVRYDIENILEKIFKGLRLKKDINNMK
ncbi:MAG: hypothetical protein RSG52_02175 [Terrisporobacter sp.]